MASYPARGTQAQHPARLREPAPCRHRRRADQPVDRAVRSHLLPERRVRDAFVNVVLAEIALPLLRVKANEAVRAPNCASSTPVPASRPCLNTKVHRRRETLILVCLDVDAIEVFAPDEGAALMRSVVHGFGWGSVTRSPQRFRPPTLVQVPLAQPKNAAPCEVCAPCERNLPDSARVYAEYQVAEPRQMCSLRHIADMN